MTEISGAAWDTAGDDIGLAADRRRPGRPAAVSPALIPLLRGNYAEPLAEEPTGDAFDDEDALAPLRGLAVGVAISTGLWALIIWAIRTWI